MIFSTNKIKPVALLCIAACAILCSCNKDVQQFPDAVVTPPSGLAIGETLAATATDSLFYKIILRSGQLQVLNNKASIFTLFVPDNNAVIASFGGTLANANATIGSLPPATCAGIVLYNLLPQNFPAASIPTAFPNVQLPTSIILDPTNPLVRMTTFPSKRTAYAYVNNIPIIATDAFVANGVIHHTAAVVAPPTTVLAGLIYTDTTLSYFTAAVARGDSGQVGLNKFDSLFKYAVTNMTVLAPNNAAFRKLIYGIAFTTARKQGADSTMADAQAKGAVAAGPNIFKSPAFFGVLSAATVRGILAYHLLASANSSGVYQPNIRVFTNNFSSTPTFVPTLVNASVPITLQPGVLVQATFTGPFATNVTFRGAGTFPSGGTPYSGTPATIVKADKHAVNGVLQVTDNVLLPQ